MRDLISFRVFRLSALGLITLLGGSGFVVSSGHAAVHSHHRRVARPAVHRRTSSAPRHRARLPRRHQALEPVEDTPQAQIAYLPLRNYRMLPPLRGSRESLVRQNQRVDREGLRRIEDDQALQALFEAGQLVGIPVSRQLHVDPRLASNRRYCRPWTAHFLARLSQEYYARFHSALQVNSAVRTVEYQRHLLRVNGNAAPAEGDIASPHLTGAAVDIGKKGLSRPQIGWIRSYLLSLQSAGKLDVEEEFQQACFHITVYTSYAAPLNPRLRKIAVSPRRRHAAVLLATRLQ